MVQDPGAMGVRRKMSTHDVRLGFGEERLKDLKARVFSGEETRKRDR